MSAWLDIGCIHDHVAGAASDSGYAIDVVCPACKGYHVVTLSTIHRFLYVCNGAVVSGGIDRETIEKGLVRRILKDACQN